jgi:signal transduction histidine kinase
MVMSDIYREMKDYTECVRTGLRVWAFDSVSYDVAMPAAKTLSVAYIHLGEKDRAEYFVRKYYDLSAEGNAKSLHENLSEMEVKYETEKKEMRIASLEKEKQLYIWLGAAGLLLAVTLVIALWQTGRNSRKEKQLIAAHSLLNGEMRERTRLAKDLHDRLGGNLSAAKIELANSAETLQNVSDKLDCCIEEIRRVAHNLMPVSLQSGIKTALEDYAAKFPGVQFHYFGEDKHLNRDVEYIIYCCAAELVNNSLKHSGAGNIDVQLVQGKDYVALTVEDDGCGFDEKSAGKGAGLKNIRDRVVSCGGKMDVVTSPEKGTETTVEIKIK